MLGVVVGPAAVAVVGATAAEAHVGDLDSTGVRGHVVDRDVHVHPLVDAVDRGGRAHVSVGAVDPGRRGLRGGVDLAVALQLRDPRVGGQRRGRGRRHLRRVAVDRAPVDLPDAHPELLGVLAGDRPCVQPVVDPDDVSLEAQCASLSADAPGVAAAVVVMTPALAIGVAPAASTAAAARFMGILSSDSVAGRCPGSCRALQTRAW